MTTVRVVGWIQKYSLPALAFVLPISPVLSNAAIIVGLIGWALRSINQRQIALSSPRTGVLFLLFGGAGVLSMVNSVNLAASLQGLVKIARAFGVFLLASEAMHTEQQLVHVMAALLLGALVASADGLLQWFLGTDPIYHHAIGSSLEGLRRITGPYHHPNDFGVYLSVVLPISLAVARVGNAWRLQGLARVVAVLVAGALLLTFARGALLGAAVATLGLIMVWRAWRWLAGGICLSLVVLVGLPAPIKTWIRTQPGPWEVVVESTHPQESRPQIWRDARNMIADHPWVGVGVNTFVLNYDRYRAPGDLIGEPPYAHNQYLQLLAEMGVVGMAIFFLLPLAAFRQGVRAYRMLEEPLQSAVLGAGCGLVAFLINGLFESALYYPRQVPLFWLGFGLLFSAPLTPPRVGQGLDLHKGRP